jgi:hypothetical protein
LLFDGNNLQIDANGSFGGLLTAGPTGQEIKIGLAAGGGTNHGIFFAATSDFLYNSGNFRLGAGKITYNGTLLNIDSQVNITGTSTVQGDLGVTTSGATFYAGASKSTGNRVVMNSGGLFGYNGTTINFSFPNSTGQFALGTGEISGWSVSSGNIEKQTSTTYAGISTGTYAFYAGGGSAGSGSPKFKVTQAGVMSAEGVQINGGSLDVGPAWPTGGFHVNSSGLLQAKGATIAGALAIQGGSTFEGNIEVATGSTIFMGSSDVNTSRVVLNPAGIQGDSGANAIFSLNTSGTGQIGGWTFDSQKLSSGTMTLNAADQTISFKNGFIMDNDVISVVAINSTNQTGGIVAGTDSNESVGSDTNESNISSLGTSSSSPTGSTFSIRLPGQSLTNAPRIAMASSSTNGSSLLLENKSSSGTSSIQLSSGGLYISLGKTGGLYLEGFTNKYHYTYNYNIQPAALQIRPDGTVTSGRSIFRSGASETNIVTNGTHSHVGLIGDLIFSTAD